MLILTKSEAEARLIEFLPNDIKILSDCFKADGKKLYLVGGCIRDMFIGKHPKDFDVCTDAMPDAVVEILKRHDIQYNLQGEHFAVVVAKMEGGDYEIATFREDVSYSDNRHPEVRLGVTIHDDVKRRDLTINALFMDLHECNVLDLVGGIDDLRSGIIRAVGDPAARFEEDHLRKLRAVRFATRLGFSIHEDTCKAIRANPALNISGERIFNELATTFATNMRADMLLHFLYTTRLVHTIFGGMKVNEVSKIDPSRIVSFNTFIACVLSEDNENVSDLLMAKNFPAKIADSVQLLHRSTRIDEINPLAFFNKRKSTNLTDSEISIYNKETFAIKWLVGFAPYSTLSETLMGRGIKGKELGETINRIYRDAFVSAINMNAQKPGEI